MFGLGGRKGRMTNVSGFDWFVCPDSFFDRPRAHILYLLALGDCGRSPDVLLTVHLFTPAGFGSTPERSILLSECRVIPARGILAQSVERSVHIRKVIGSSPINAHPFLLLSFRGKQDFSETWRSGKTENPMRLPTHGSTCLNSSVVERPDVRKVAGSNPV